MRKIHFFLVFLFLNISISFAQDRTKNYRLHSHNDYLQTVPFWEAFATHIESIEVDVLFVDNELYVAHEKESITEARTLVSLYLEPIRKAFELNIGGIKNFQLLIDIKTEPYATLKKLEEVMKPYQDILRGNHQGSKVDIVISGNRPSPKDYQNYPDYIQFDYQDITDTTALPLDKIALISLNFKNISGWNGKGSIIAKERKALKKAIEVAHSLNKPIRFWASPDSKTAWKKLKDLGVDYINTDKPFEAQSYLKLLEERTFTRKEVTKIYKPEFKIDGIHKPIKNVILLIGDGNGLAQISATLFFNDNQLSLATLKNMGLIITHSADDLTTDSAAAGTALATGHKVKNRSLGIKPDGTPLKNIPEYLQQYHYLTGIVTDDQITGAIPAAFYAHQPDREMLREIGFDLPSSPLNLFIGAGKESFMLEKGMEKFSESGFSMLKSLNQIGPSSKEKVGYLASSDNLSTWEKGRKGFLPNATIQALSYLSREGKPFFLMIEGATVNTGGKLNHQGTLIEAGIDFDQAVAAALKFADNNRETLVIITADHETGGLTIPHGELETGEVQLEFTTNDHTAVLVPIFAYGPHADEFRGIYQNTEVYHKIIALIEKYRR